MYLCCPRCERHFDTDTERELDPNGIVCGRCVEALDPEGSGKVPAWVRKPPAHKPDRIDRLIAQADYHAPQAIWERGYDAATAVAYRVAREVLAQEIAAGVKGTAWAGVVLERLEMALGGGATEPGHTTPDQDEEIKRDYYSGPPGSFTGD